MTRKIVGNSQLTTREVPYSGVCPIRKKQAVVTVHTIGQISCKTDLQKTYKDAGRHCSLLGDKWEPCISSCSLVTDKY